MRFLRLLVVTLALAAFSLQARPAHAAIVTGTLTYSPPIWTKKSGERATTLINRQDCLDDAYATFSVKILNAVGNFEVWSGENCDMVANRSPTATGSVKTCVKVFSASYSEKSAAIHVRDMVNAYTSTTFPADVTACDSMPGFGAISRSLFFLVVNPSDFSSLVNAVPPWKFQFDVTPPAAPSGVTAQPGDNTLVTSFTAPTNETNLLRYHFYCAEAAQVANTGGTAGTDTGGTAGTDAASTAGTDTGGTAGTDAASTAGTDTGGTAGTDTGGTAGTDAVSTGGTAGTDTGGSAGSAGTAGTAGSAGTSSVAVDPSCTSKLLVPGQPAEPRPAGVIDCGTIPATGATGGESSPSLENGLLRYAIAVATEDEVGNIGPLSNLACGTPKDVTGFYEAYRRAGGEGGGGYCTFAPARRGELAGIIPLALGACALLRRRR